jgi:Cns1/TTC4 Wheel domain
LDPESDLIFPAIFLYPLSSQSDIIPDYPLTSTLEENLSIVLEEPAPWDIKREYTVASTECFMEYPKDDGLMGLVKIGKSTTMGKVLKGKVLYDGIIRIFVLPKQSSQEWISEWKAQNNKS